MAEPIKKVRRRPSGRAVVHAEHVSRVDAYGDRAVKTFTQEAWDAIPGVHFMNKEGITKLSKGGWVLGQGKLADAPPSLKKERPVKPEPVTPVEDAPKVEKSTGLAFEK